MALVKLDTPIKDFVANVLQGSLVHTAIKVIQYKLQSGPNTECNHRVFSGIKISVFIPFFVFNVACSLDFQDGIGGWEMTGRAFIYQPTFGDNPIERGRESAQ